MGFIREIRRDIEQEALCLMREYRSLLFAEAKQLTNDDSVAEDLVMKTIESYLAQPDEGLPAKGKVRAWLRTTLRNHFNNSVRGKARACTVYLDEEDAARIDEIAPADNSSDEAILAHSDAELVRNVLARLPESARSVIVMHYFESLSIRQIAELLRKSPDSVKSNLYYARKVLAKRLGKMMGRAALAIAALIFGGSLLYAAAVATGLAPSPFAAPEPAAEQPLEALGPLESLEDPAPLEAPETNEAPQQVELTTTNLTTTNNEETTMNTQVVKSAAVKALAAGAMLAAAAPTLAARSARADSLKNYQVLQYLESSGTQAIDTGVKYGKSTRLRFRMQTLNDKHVGAIDACSDSNHDRFHFRVESNQFRFFCFHGVGQFTFGTQDENWHTYDINRAERKIYRDGAYQAAFAIADEDEYTLDEEDHSTIWLFGRNGNQSSLIQYATARIGTIELWQDDRQERLLIPCKRLRDNELGMYDLIRKEFLVNVGKGTFTAGPEGLGCVEIPPQIFEGQAEICPEVVIKNAGQTRVEGTDYTLAWSRNTSIGIGILKITPLGDYVNCGSVEVPFAIVPPEGWLPSEYRRVAYLESTRGGRQYVDTGVHPTGSMRFQVFLQAPRSEAMSQFGMIDDKGGGTYERFHIGKNESNIYGCTGVKISTGFNYVTYVGHNWVAMTLRTRPNGGSPKGWFVLGGNSQELSDIGAFSEGNSTIWLFGRNSDTDSLKTYSAFRLMYADIKEGDDDLVTTHHFVPCRRVADGELGVYDTVARQFHYDTGRVARGAAAFVAGPDVGDSWRPGTVIRLN